MKVKVKTENKRTSN